MAEPATTAAPAAGEPTPADNGQGKDQPKTFTQDQVNALIAREKGQIQSKFADYDDLKAKAARFDEVAESQKTEAQKAAEKVAAAEGRATTAESKLLRLEVAASKGVPAEHAHRLVGSTKAELEADAEALLKTLAPGTSFDGGPQGAAAPTNDMNAFIRAGARRNRV